MSKLQFYGTGRRKKSKARVWLIPGNGSFSVNGCPLDLYFKREVLRMLLKQPFKSYEFHNKYDVKATVKSGGLSGQSGAIKLGIARALLCLGDNDLKLNLKRNGFLTRDSRMVERKKYGQPGARKKYQYSKR